MLRHYSHVSSQSVSRSVLNIDIWPLLTTHLTPFCCQFISLIHTFPVTSHTHLHNFSLNASVLFHVRCSWHSPWWVRSLKFWISICSCLSVKLLLCCYVFTCICLLVYLSAGLHSNYWMDVPKYSERDGFVIAFFNIAKQDILWHSNTFPKSNAWIEKNKNWNIQKAGVYECIIVFFLAAAVWYQKAQYSCNYRQYKAMWRLNICVKPLSILLLFHNQILWT